MSFVKNKQICKRCGKCASEPLPTIIHVGEYNTLAPNMYGMKTALHLCKECSDALNDFLKPQYIITKENIIEYQRTFGKESAKDLLILAGPDGYEDDYDSMMKDLEAGAV